MCWVGAKVPYFFISQEKFNFAHFLAKFELVSKSAVFFSCAGKKNSLLRLSQSVRYKLFQEKKRNKLKKKQLLENKKNRPQISKMGKGKILGNWSPGISQKLPVTQPFTDFMLKFFLCLESLEVKLFQEKKKNSLFFFFSEKVEKIKNKNFPKWVSQ